MDFRLGFPLRASVSIWKDRDQPRPDSLKDLMVDCARWFEHWGARTDLSTPDVLEISFSHWRWELTPPFKGVRRARLTAAETKFATHLTASAESDLFGPVFAILLGNQITQAIGPGPRWVGALVGLATAGLYWLLAWVGLQLSLSDLARKVQSGPPGA